MESRCWGANPERNRTGQCDDRGADVPVGRDQPIGILPDGVPVRGCGPGCGTAGCDSADRSGVSQLRAASNHPGAEAAGLARESEAGVSDSAPGQSVVSAEAEVRGDDRFQPWVDDIPEPGPGAEAQWDRSALGG